MRYVLARDELEIRLEEVLRNNMIELGESSEPESAVKKAVQTVV